MRRARYLSINWVVTFAAAVMWLTGWCGAADAAGSFFMGLGDLPGGTFSSSAGGVSADGSRVVGSSNSASGGEAFRWTQVGGMVGLGDLSGGPFASGANGVSADGSVVVGSSAVETVSSHGEPPFRTLYRAFRWTQGQGMISLGRLRNSDTTSFGDDVSADGSVVVGMSGVHPFREAAHGEAFRWRQGSGTVGLGVLPGYSYSHASGVSADGSVIVGRSWSGARIFIGGEAFRWRQGSGMVSLGDLPGGSTNSHAYGVSADGSVIVGQATSASGSEAFRWTQGGGMVALGILPGFGVSLARDVSADGSVVIGYSSSGSASYEAFVWDAIHGMRSLRDVLVNDFDLGASLSGWTLRSATGISADGQVIVGSGFNPNGDLEAWIARLGPQPALPGDFNNDGTVDAADYVVWRKNDGTPAGYDTWRAHFGQTAGSGAAPPSANSDPAPGNAVWRVPAASVPEPTSAALLTIGVMIATRRRAK